MADKQCEENHTGRTTPTNFECGRKSHSSQNPPGIRRTTPDATQNAEMGRIEKPVLRKIQAPKVNQNAEMVYSEQPVLPSNEWQVRPGQAGV